MYYDYTVVSRIYTPRFATLVLVKSVGGAYMRDLTFYLANTPLLPVPRLDVHIRTLLLQTDRSCRSTLAIDSVVTRAPETRSSRSTDRGWPQRRQRRFPSIPQVCSFNVVLLIDTTREHACDLIAVPWTLASFLHCHRDLELDSVGVSTKIISVEWPWLGGLYAR